MTPRFSGKRNRIYKIRLVIAGFIALTLSTGIIVNSVGQFILPIHEDMGYKIGTISLAFSIVWGTVSLSAATIAKFIDRYSPRVCMAISASVLSVMALVISFTTQIWQFYICTIIMGLVFTGLHTLPVSVMINDSFSRKKNMATSIAFAGTGIGGMVFNPIFNAIIHNFGWRWGFVVMSAVYLIGGLIIVWLVKLPKREKSVSEKHGNGNIVDRNIVMDNVNINENVHIGGNIHTNGIDKTEYMEIEVAENYPVDSAEKAVGDDLSGGLSYKEAIRSRTFLLMVMGIMIFCGTGSGTMMHSVPYMIDVGMSSGRASFLFSIFMFILAISKITLGFILEKLGTEKGTMLGIFFYIGSIASLFLLRISPMFYVVFLIFGGIGLSTATVTTPIITAHFFGNRDYTRILGAAIIFNGLGNLIFPFMLGLLFDITGSYLAGWLSLVTLLIAALVFYRINFNFNKE